MFSDLDPDVRANAAPPALQTGEITSQYMYQPTVAVGGSFRPLTPHQLAQAAKAGLYFSVDSDTPVDLSEWLPFASDIQGLYFAGKGRAIRGVKTLESFTSLRSLVAEAIRDSADISQLPMLEEARVGPTWVSSAAANPHVKYLSLTGRLDGVEVRGPVITLALESARVDLGIIRDVSQLSHLGVATSDSLDLAPIKAAPHLRSIMVRSRELASPDTLASLPRLTKLVLDGIRDSPGIAEVVRGLDLTFFESHANYLFDADFASEVRHRPGHWYVNRQREK